MEIFISSMTCFPGGARGKANNTDQPWRTFASDSVLISCWVPQLINAIQSDWSHHVSCIYFQDFWVFIIWLHQSNHKCVHICLTVCWGTLASLQRISFRFEYQVIFSTHFFRIYHVPVCIFWLTVNHAE